MKGPGEKRTRQQEAAIVTLLTAPPLIDEDARRRVRAALGRPSRQGDG